MQKSPLLRRRNRRARPELQRLEDRRFFAAVYPTAAEQLTVEMINRARANPSAEAARLGIDLNEGLAAGTISTAAKQPLAINPYLVDGAKKHSQYQLDTDTMTHTGAGGSSPGDRMAAAGYVFAGSYSWAENVAYRWSSSALDPNTTAPKLHDDLFIDTYASNRGHRINMMKASLKEIGAGIQTGEFQGHTNTVFLTEDFAYSGSGSFLTGVAYTDAVTQNNFYTPGEGLGGVTIKATNLSSGVAAQTMTWGSGGYSLKLAPGTYTVTASGGGVSGTITRNNVVIGSENVKADFVPGSTTQPPPAPPPPPPPPQSPPPPPSGTATIAGNLFNDLNGNGVKNTGEGNLAGWKVWLDADKDGALDTGEKTATTDAYGNYKFTGLPAASYRVREVLNSGWRRTYPSGAWYDVTLASGGSSTKNFGNTQKILISGSVFNDANGDRLKNSGEAGLANWRVFIDKDGDGVFDSGERSTLTDASGNWSFKDLTAGTYRVRVVQQTGWSRTTPTSGYYSLTLGNGASSTGRVFGERKI